MSPAGLIFLSYQIAARLVDGLSLTSLAIALHAVQLFCTSRDYCCSPCR